MLKIIMKIYIIFYIHKDVLAEPRIAMVMRRKDERSVFINMFIKLLIAAHYPSSAISQS